MFESKINRGKANGYAPLDGSGKVPLDKLPPIQSTINTGSFATTGSNTFTDNQIISGSGDSSLTIGEVNTIAGPSFGLRVSGSDGAPLFLTSDGTLLIGAITNPTNVSDDASFFANQLNSFPISNGPTAAILVQKSGSFQSNWVFDYDGKSYFPSDITIGYNSLGGGLTSGSLNITKGNINVSGSLYFGSGSVISETSSSTIITPPGATYGQSLVIRQTAMVNLYSDHPLGFYLGDTITLTFQPDGNGAVSGSAPYLFTGCTESQLGTSLSGSLEFDNEVTKSLTWTIPALSDITGFTFDIYNFQYDATQSISLSSSGSSEHSHIHLVSGNPSLVDIYLGDDDQYVKIEKNGGDVVIGTNLDTHHWTFDGSGSLILPNDMVIDASVDFGILQIGGDGTYIKIDDGGAPPSLTIATNGGENEWVFGDDGTLTLPDSSPILFGGNNCQIQAGQGFRISSDGGILIDVTGSQWVFGPDGEITTPGDINVSGSINTTGSLNIATGSLNIRNGNINVSGSLNISSSLVVSSTIVNNGNIEALNSDLIIDGGDIILSGSLLISGSINGVDNLVTTSSFNTFSSSVDTTFAKNIRVFSDTTATITVAESDSGKVYIGKRSSSTQVFTLPSASTAGLTYTFICGDVGGMVQIKGQAGDTINCKSNADGTDRVSVSVAATTGIRNNAATNVLGDNITLVSDGITTWWMTAQSGIFSSL